MKQIPTYYRIYLLTVWKEAVRVTPENKTDLEPTTDTGWRLCLEDPRTGQRRGFANAVDLVAILLTELGHGEELSS